MAIYNQQEIYYSVKIDTSYFRFNFFIMVNDAEKSSSKK